MIKLNNKAYTFVEAMVVVMISTIVFAGVYSTFMVGNRAWTHYNDTVAAKKEARRALFAMIKEIREAENVRVVEGVNQSAIHLYRPLVGPVSFLWTRKGGDANKIIRRSRYDHRIVAQYISDLSVQRAKDYVVIDITAGKADSKGKVIEVVLNGRVTLRAKTPYFQ